MRFEGKRALVTGAAGGIGAALVRMLRAEGARVAVTDRDVSGVEAEAHLPGDLRDGAFCDGLPARAAQALGGLDILCNNAG
ncbi:MAG: SDR family NAD(P)-dependent oxidoreductase, partial [Roseovarius sp.]